MDSTGYDCNRAGYQQYASDPARPVTADPETAALAANHLHRKQPDSDQRSACRATVQAEYRPAVDTLPAQLAGKPAAVMQNNVSSLAPTGRLHRAIQKRR